MVVGGLGFVAFDVGKLALDPLGVKAHFVQPR